MEINKPNACTISKILKSSALLIFSLINDVGADEANYHKGQGCTLQRR